MERDGFYVCVSCGCRLLPGEQERCADCGPAEQPCVECGSAETNIVAQCQSCGGAVCGECQGIHQMRC